MPYCVHPDTGKLCIPVTAENIEVFDPASVPSISSLVLDLKESGTVTVPGLQEFEHFCCL